ncbi:hypothetical protein [uncultured Salipiger sp.]|uniref:hypothetical protein n=1 Tax=uncultured Salipiger sp. TaxID=499810 RepID=UPI0025937AFD|nr:hypothetical protein [uncultured Salipiger sp.]
MSRLTVPSAGISPGRAARAVPQPVPEGGAEFAQFGQTMLAVGTQLENDRLDREMKRAQVDLTRDVNDLRLQVEQIGDPDAAEAAWSQGVSGLREQYQTGTNAAGRPLVDPKNANDFGLMFDQLTNSVAYSVGRRTIDLRNAEREATWINYAHEATRLGANADQPTVDLLMTNGNSVIDGLLASGAIDAAEAARRRIGLQADISNAKAIRMVEEDPQGFIAQADEGGFAGLEADTVARYQVTAKNNIEAREAAATREATKRADDRVTDIRDIARDDRISTDEAYLETDDAKASEYYGEAKAAVALQREYASLKRMTPDQLMDIIDQEEAQKVAKPYQTERLKLLNDLLDDHDTGYTDDPVGYANKTGVASIEPIDWTADSTTLANELSRRSEIGTQLVDSGYTHTRRVLTEEEADALSDVLDVEAEPEERLRIAGVLARQLGGAELARLSNDPVLTHAGDFVAAGYPPGKALDMLRGQAAMDRDNVVMPPLKDRRGTSFQVLDQVYADLPGGDGLEARTLAAADALYARRMGRIDPTADIDQDRYSQALHEVLGGTGAYGSASARGGIQQVDGMMTILPKGVSAEDAEQAYRNVGLISDPERPRAATWTEARALEVFQKASGGQTPTIEGAFPSQRTLEDLRLLAVGDDEYALVRPSSDPIDPPTALENSSGGLFKFSLRRLIREARR